MSVRMRVSAAALLVAATLAIVVAPRATAATSLITTYAGGPGYGEATNLAHRPFGLAVHGHLLYITELNDLVLRGNQAVVRVLDLRTGVERVLAGSGRYGNWGDDMPATEVQLGGPAGISVDAAGRVFFADAHNSRVRMVDTNGFISTVAGGGTGQYDVGDGRPATDAFLYWPSDVVVDGDGNLFIADTNAHRVRRVDADTGVITTVAGTGVSGFSGDGGPGTAAQLSFPSDLAFGPDGTLYISDTDNRRVRTLTRGGIIATVSGGGTAAKEDGAKLSELATGLGKLAFSPDGVMYGADGTHVYRVDAGGILHTVAGNGTAPHNPDGTAPPVPEGVPALQSPIQPTALAFDADGNLYSTDNLRVRRIDPDGVITTIAGNGLLTVGGDGGPATGAQIWSPTTLFMDPAGNLFINDSSARIRRVDPSGVISTVAGNARLGGWSGDGGPAQDADITNAAGFATDAAGNLYFSDDTVIRRIDTSGVITTIAGLDGWAATWETVDDVVPALKAYMEKPTGLTFDGVGNLYVADAGRIRRIDTNGLISTVAGGGNPADSVGDGLPAREAHLWGPTEVAFDSQGRMIIVETQGSRIRRVETDGTIHTIAGDGSWEFAGDGGPSTAAKVWFPGGLAVDTQGNIFFSDQMNNRVRKIDANGIITTIAGSRYYGFYGDGGPAAGAVFDSPGDVTLDQAGNLYVADLENRRVRKISRAGGPPAVAATLPPWLSIPATTTTTVPPTTTTVAPTTTTSTTTTTTTTVPPPPPTPNRPYSNWAQPAGPPLDGIGSWLAVANEPGAGSAWFYSHVFAFSGGSATGVVGLAKTAAGKFAIASVRGPDGLSHDAVAPFDWKAGRIYFPLVYELAPGQWGAWVYDYDAQTWAGIGLLVIPASWGKLSGASETTVTWIGATQSGCAKYPRAEVFNHPPTGYRAGVATQSVLVRSGSPGYGCAAIASAGPAPWQSYVVGGG